MSLFKRLKGGQKTTGMFADLGEANTGIGLGDSPVKPPRKRFGDTFKGLNIRFGSRAKAKGKQIDASAAELVEVDSGQVLVAFGMRWRTLVKAGGKEAAQQIASKAGSTHFILAQHQIGYTKVNKGIERPIYPALLLVAKTNSGSGVYSMTLSQEEGCYWFATVRAGLPGGVDEVVSGLSTADAIKRIRALESQFVDESPAVFTDIRQAGIEGQRNFSIHDVFDVVRGDAERLLKVKSGQSALPKPLVIVGGVLVALFVADKAYDAYNEKMRREAMDRNRVADLSPEEAWAPVVKKFEETNAVAGIEALAQVRQSLGSMPALLWGWKLYASRCQASELIAGKQSWGCQATYERLPVGITAKQMSDRIATSSFKSLVITYPTSSTMQASWALSIQTKSITLDGLQDVKPVQIDTLSELQLAFPILAARPELSLTEIQLPAPLKQDGSPQPKPASLPLVFEGNVSIKGPLRSIDVLVPKLGHVTWNSIGMQIEPMADAQQKGITSSAILVEANGKVLAKEVLK